jgi:hypothetical protein
MVAVGASHLSISQRKEFSYGLISFTFQYTFTFLRLCDVQGKREKPSCADVLHDD